MEPMFEQNFPNCLENLKLQNYRAATSDLYPISKKTAMLGNASDRVVERFAQLMCEVITLLADKVQNDPDGKENYRHLLTDAYRILRNSCTASTKVQEQLGGDRGKQIMQSTSVIADAVLTLFTGENMVQVLAVTIQFLFNLGVGIEKNQDLVWDYFKPKLRTWFEMPKGKDDQEEERAIKIVNIACSVVDACLPRQWQRNSHFLEDYVSRDIMKAAIESADYYRVDFGKKAMVKVVQVPDLGKVLFSSLFFHARYYVLMIMKEVINDWRNKDEKGSEAPTLHSNLQFLAETLILSRPVLRAEMMACRTLDVPQDLEGHVKMLEVLAVASCCKAYAPTLRSVTVSRVDEPRTLIDYALGFLKDIHEEGKKSYNMLTMVRSGEDVDPSHPAYQLRCDLIRLIGNLAYLSKPVQDQVREFEGRSGLPLLLEHTVIDLRNPFMGEWTKLALSNLVRSNEESAKFIHSITQQGQINGTGILQGCGLILERDGDRMKIRAEGTQPSLQQLSEKEPSRF